MKHYAKIIFEVIAETIVTAQVPQAGINSATQQVMLLDLKLISKK